MIPFSIGCAIGALYTYFLFRWLRREMALVIFGLSMGAEVISLTLYAVRGL